jgi:uncharacterized membrane protein YedE/YeeE
MPGPLAAALSALVAGLLFGFGLALSQMTNPAKVLGFLDIAGDWDPSLAFVMAGAVAVSFLAFRRAGSWRRPIFGDAFQLPTRRDIDGLLIAGSLLFGVGWGLAGICPGPALTAIVSGQGKVFLFLAAMLAGMVAFQVLPPTHLPRGKK